MIFALKLENTEENRLPSSYCHPQNHCFRPISGLTAHFHFNHNFMPCIYHLCLLYSLWFSFSLSIILSSPHLLRESLRHTTCKRAVCVHTNYCNNWCVLFEFVPLRSVNLKDFNWAPELECHSNMQHMTFTKCLCAFVWMKSAWNEKWLFAQILNGKFNKIPYDKRWREN